MELINLGEMSFLGKRAVRDDFRSLALIEPETIVAGGAVRRFLRGETNDSDIDLFFHNQDDRDRQQQTLANAGFVVTRSIGQTLQMELRDQVVQLIGIAWYASVEDLLDSFDFTICQFVFHKGVFYATPEALSDLLRKRLVVHKITFPVASLRRLLKYGRQGFTVCSGSMAEFLKQAQQVEITAEPQYID